MKSKELISQLSKYQQAIELILDSESSKEVKLSEIRRVNYKIAKLVQA